MSVKTITVSSDTEVKVPKIKLAELSEANIWKYVGTCFDFTGEDNGDHIRDINHASERASKKLAKKLSPRNISIEVIIDPMIPNSLATLSKIEPLICEIGENASAAVEPGPGKIILRTWWKGGYVGVDAIGLDSNIPGVIKDQIMKPGFTTKAGEWDTGFGLHMTNVKAHELQGTVEFFDANDENGVGFRLSVPVINSIPPQAPEALLGLPELESIEKTVQSNINLNFPSFANNYMEVDSYGQLQGQFRA